MLNILQIEDRLKDMSEDVVKRMVTEPNSTVPPFLATNELNRRDRMRKEFQMRQAQEMPTVAEQLVTGAGMPNEAMSQMAMNMAPKSDIAGNTGLEAMMPKATMPETEEDEIMLMEDEDPLRMNEGGVVQSDPIERGFDNNVDNVPSRGGSLTQNQLGMLGSMIRFGRPSGLQGLGMDIRRQVAGRTDGEVNEFITDVENMAEERFDVNLGQSTMPTPFSGKGGGHGDPRTQRPNFNALGYSTGSRPAIRPGGASAFGSVMRRMNEGGLASMSNGGDVEYKGFIQRALEMMMPSRFNMQNTASASPNESTVVTGGSPYETDENRTQMSPTSDKKDKKTPPPPTTTAGPSSFDKILGMIQEDRESAKEQRDRDRYLALMQFGLNLAKRGQLEDTGEGLKTLAMSNKAYQDQLAKLRGMDVQAMLTKENIAGRERAASATAQAALERALAKGGLDEKDLVSIVSSLRSDIADYRKQLGEGYNLSPKDKATVKSNLDAAINELNRYRGILEGKRSSQDVTSDVYGK
tara:strand:+ start:2697 stop:4265 length:1569 start_codon:yes stop_codon:yes gene_type:complete